MRKFFHYIDEVRYFGFPRHEYSVKGWCGTPTLEAASELWVASEGDLVPCLTSIERQDVAAHFGQAAMQYSGFQALLRADRHTQNLRFFETETEGAVPVFIVNKPSESTDSDTKLSRYESWLSERETHLFWPADTIAARLGTLRSMPLISVILVLDQPDRYRLHRSVASVLDQSYANWELLVSDRRSASVTTRGGLAKFPLQDGRVRFFVSDRDLGTACALNVAVEAAKGEFVVVLDQSDELHPYALLEAARQLNRLPEADLVYSDEDEICDEGIRSHPIFKPNFDDDSLLAHNSLGGMVCFRKTLIAQAGGFRNVGQGFEQWDLTIRCQS